MRARRSLLALAAVLGLALATVALRLVIAEAVLTALLSGRGLAPVALEVTALDLDSLTLEHLRLTDRLSVGRLTAGFDLLAGAIERLELDTARLGLDLTGEGPPLGPLSVLLGDGDGDGSSPAPLVTLRNATLLADTAVGPLEAAVEGSATPAAGGATGVALRYDLAAPLGRLAGAAQLVLASDGTYTGTLEVADGAAGLAALGLRAEGLAGQLGFAAGPEGLSRLSGTLATPALRLPGEAQAGLELSFTLVDGRLAFDAAATFEGRDLELVASGTASDFAGAAPVTLEARLRAEDLARLPLPPHPLTPETGGGTLSLSLSGTLPPPPGNRLLGATLQGRARLSLSELSHQGRYRDAGITLELDASLHDRVLSLGLAGPSSLEVAAPVPELAAFLGLAKKDLARLRLSADAQALTVSLRHEGEGYAARVEAAPLMAELGGLRAELTGGLDLGGGTSGALEALQGTFDLSASGSWELPDRTRIGGARLMAPLRVKGDGEALSLALAQDASLRIRSLGRPESLVPLGVSLQLSDGLLRLPWGSPAETRYGLTLRPIAGGVDWPWQVTLLPASDDPLELLVAPTRVRLEGTAGSASLVAEIARVAAERYETAAEAITLEARLDPGRATAQVSVGSLRSPLLPAASLEGSLEQRGDRAGFEGRLGGHPLWQAVPLAAAHDLATGAGTVRLGPLSLRFEPGSPLAAALAPLLGGLLATAGSADASATLSWNPDHLGGDASLVLRDLAVSSEDLALSGLAVDLRLDDLIGPGSPPSQAFSIARVTRPLEIADVTGRLRIRPGRPPKLLLEAVSFDTSGARLRVDKALVDPGAARNALVLEVERLDLEALTRALDIEGVSGAGILAGRVPLALEGRRLVITDGLLESQAPGIVRYRSRESQALLEGVEAGEGLDSVALFDDPFRLTLLALTNFHYDALTLQVANSPDGKANLKLGLKGRNPDLLSGYPFDLNVNLDTNLVPLLEAVENGLVISRDLLPRSWRFGR